MTAEGGEPSGGTQTLLVTAYYSPEPGQSAYARGSYEADLIFNGNGDVGADGTAVYPGMIAAPEELPFGSRIVIPSLGVGTVHDRGGRIFTWDDREVTRIDVWMGRGEGGLARALTWGAHTVDGTIYAPGDGPQEGIDLASLPAPTEALSILPAAPSYLLSIDTLSHGETSPVVATLQKFLLDLGYFDHAVTGYFGDVTLDAVRDFQRDAAIEDDPRNPTASTLETVVLHQTLWGGRPDPLPEEIVSEESIGKPVRIAQRLLKMVGAYQGSIDGIFSPQLAENIAQFQLDHGIIAQFGETGTGMLGPRTRRALLTVWRSRRLDDRRTTLLANLRSPTPS